MNNARGIRTDMHVEQALQKLQAIFAETHQAVAPELPLPPQEKQIRIGPTPCARHRGEILYLANWRYSINLEGRRDGYALMDAIRAEWRRRGYKLDERQYEKPSMLRISAKGDGFRFIKAQYPAPTNDLLSLYGVTPCVPYPGRERLSQLMEESREAVVDLPWKKQPVDRTGKCLGADEQVVGSFLKFYNEVDLGSRSGDGPELLSAMESYWQTRGFEPEKRGMTSRHPGILASIDNFRLIASFGNNRFWISGETPCSPTGRRDFSSIVDALERMQNWKPKKPAGVSKSSGSTTVK